MSKIESFPRDESVKRLNSLLRRSSLNEPLILNPFVLNIKLPWYEYIKIAVMSVTVAPLRIVCIIPTFLLAWGFAKIGCISATSETFAGPISFWRKVIRWIVRKLMRLIFVFMGYLWVETRGTRAHSNETMLITVAPHQSFCDILLGFVGRSMSGVTKIENMTIPGVGCIGRLTQPVVVNRASEHSRTHVQNLIKERTALAGKMPQCAIFPEGTTSNGQCLINFKAGAFSPGKPVQPALLTYPNRIKCMVWVVEQPSVLWMTWVMLCQFYNRCRIEYLPVYYPSIEEQQNAKLFGNNVRNLMAKHLNVPTTDHSFEDVKIMKLARKYKLPQAECVLEFSKMGRLLKLNFDRVEEYIKYFAELAKDQNGKITIEKFADYLGMPVTPEVERLFNLYDRNGSGYIDFREYVIGLILISAPATTKTSLRCAFELLDATKDGVVSKKDFENVMITAFNMEKPAISVIFNEIDINKTGQINYDEFEKFAQNKPEFIKVISLYTEFQMEAEALKYRETESLV